MLVNPGLVEGGGAAYLRTLDLIGLGGTSVFVILELATTPTGSPGGTGPDLTAIFESDGTVTLTTGAETATFGLEDTTEPYQYSAAVGDGAALAAYITAIKRTGRQSHDDPARRQPSHCHHSLSKLATPKLGFKTLQSLL